jgi:hypothetical protein
MEKDELTLIHVDNNSSHISFGDMCRRMSEVEGILSNDLLSKKDFGLLIGVSDRTLQRWEREIVEADKVIALHYYRFQQYEKPGFQVPMLDAYRRMILLVIRKAKLLGNSKTRIIEILQKLEFRRGKFDEIMKSLKKQSTSN